MAKAKLTSKGQVTIPKEVREQLGLEPGDEVEFVVEKGKYRMRKVPPQNPFAPWRGFLKEHAGKSSDELVDEMRGERLDYRD